MAQSDHVHIDPSLSGGHGIGDNESYQYDRGYGHDQASFFPGGWGVVDPELQHAANYSNGTALYSQNWHQPQVQQPTTTTQSAPFDPSRAYFNSQYLEHTPSRLAPSPSHVSPQFVAPHGGTSNMLLHQQPVQPASQTSSSYQTSHSTNTISPAALQTATVPPLPKESSTPTGSAHRPIPAGSTVTVPAIPPRPLNVIALPPPDTPKGVDKGGFTVIDYDELAAGTNSTRLHNFLNISLCQYELPITKNTIPNYIARKSRNEIKRLAATDPALTAKIKKATSKPVKKVLPKVAAARVAINAAGVKVEAKESPVELSSASESSDDDSEYHSSDSEDEEAEPSPLPTSRPQQALEGIRYDAMKAVWRPRNRFAEAEQIRNGLKDFWELVRTIRDRWKGDNDAVKKAVDTKKLSEVPILKERVNTQRDMLEAALRATLDFGHPDIVRLFGENKPMMFALYQFLHERLKDNDYDGSFINTTLQLLSRCSTLNSAALEQTSLIKALERFAKRSKDSIKALAKKIMDNANKSGKGNPVKAVKSTDPKAADPKSKAETSVKASSAKVDAPKRTMSSDSSSSIQMIKRPVGSAASASAVKPAGTQLKKPVTAAESKTAAPAAAKARPVASKAPTTNFFASLNVPKKSAAATAAATAAAKVKAAATAAAEKKIAAPATPAFSFAETMASLEKPKETEKAKKVDKSVPNETPEQRAKRLRKEERRKLRVTFKPDHSLVAVRIFQHDPEEEQGHDANMVRDASDINSEGRMFKQHKEMMDIDEDDDEPLEKTWGEFKKPSVIDFAEMDADARERNYEKYGGDIKCESPERAKQDSRMANTLMVHYFTRADIPSCPKEPVDPYAGDQQETKTWTPPVAGSVYDVRAKTVAPPPAIDVAAILSGLTPFAAPAPAPAAAPAPAPVQPPAPAAPPTDSNDPYAAIQNILAQFSQPPAGAPQQQAQPPVPQWAAPAPQPQQAQTAGIDSILASLRAHGQPADQPQQQSQPTAAPPAGQQWPAAWPNAALPGWPPAPAATATPADTSALLAMFGMNPAMMANIPGFGNFGQQPQQQDQQASHNNNNYDDYHDYHNSGSNNNNTSRKRGRDNADDYDDRGGGRNKFQKGKKQQKDWDAPNDGKPKFVVQCRFFKEGKCKKGDACTFRHD